MLYSWNTRSLRQRSEDGYKVINPVPCILRDALRNPGDIPDLLLLQLQVRVEHAILELLQERLLVQVHLRVEEPVLQLRRRTQIVSTIRRRARLVLEERAVLAHALARGAHLVDVVRLRELVVPLGEEPADRGEELRALLLLELGAEGVDGDVDRAAVGLEGEDAEHDVCGGPAEGAAEGGEVLEVGFVERVADDLDVEVVEVGCGHGVPEVVGYVGEGGWMVVSI